MCGTGGLHRRRSRDIQAGASQDGAIKGGALKILLALLAGAMMLTACAISVDETSLIPELEEPAADVRLATPEGYVQSEAFVPVGDLGVVRAVRLDRLDTDTVVLFAGGSGYFTARASRRLARLAELTRADVITFDYPGRAGTTLPITTEALVEMGPALVAHFRNEGWIGAGRVYAYGFSFGGASASNLARTGGFSGLILESTSSDIVAMGRNMIPAIARPLVRLEVDEDLSAFDYFGFAVEARAPILLLAAQEDAQADLATVNAFAARLSAAGAEVVVIETPGRHGDAIYSEEAATAIGTFIAPAP